MDWRLKALAFRALDLPGGAHAHFFLQRYVTRNWPRREARLGSFAARAERIISEYDRHVGIAPRSVLEIGAGRDLALPLALKKLGVDQVIASDVARLAKLDLIRHAADRILSDKSKFKSWDDLEKFGISYRAPHRVSVLDELVDCSCSNEVLEHVPSGQLPELLAGLRAVTRKLTVHSIDYTDHYARSDSGISRLNFLKYSDQEWKPFNSGMHYVNRLRHSDYLRMFREAGFSIVEENSVLGELPKDLKISDQFRHYEPNDLLAIKGRIVAR